MTDNKKETSPEATAEASFRAGEGEGAVLGAAVLGDGASSGAGERPLAVQDLGMVPYGRALELQKELVARRQREEIPDTLLLLEHPPVITRGKRTAPEDMLLSPEALSARGVEVFDIDRGGEATYHGPGQLVGYLIFHLYHHQRRLKRFVHNIEEVFISVLQDEYGIEAGREEKHRGVWVGNEKITAIGISLHGGVTMHGFAFNINTNLDHYSWIVPCGIRDKGVCSLETLTGAKQDMQRLKEATARKFVQVFGFDRLEGPFHGSAPSGETISAEGEGGTL
jgi:lipoyl(octanoyl) transferase